jgi:hypothetical protein
LIDISIGEAIILALTAVGVCFWIVEIADLYKSTSASFSGMLASYALALTFATSARTSILTLVFGLPFERTQVCTI